MSLPSCKHAHAMTARTNKAARKGYAANPHLRRARAESAHLRRYWQHYRRVPPDNSFMTLRRLLHTAKHVYLRAGQPRASFDWHGARLAVRCSAFGQLSVLDLATSHVLVTTGAGAC